MSYIQMDFESQYLCGNTQISIILPDRPQQLSAREFYTSGKEYKVLYLLHGTAGDHSDWVRKSNIELYACERDLIVVMPTGLNTNYANWASFSLGYNMYDFLTEELMPMIENWFPVSKKREDTYIAGLSMGGRGTCVYAFNHPEKFAAAAILSAAPRDMAWSAEHDRPMFERMNKAAIVNYGSLEGFLNSYENTWDIITAKAKDPSLPRLYFSSGTEDHLYPSYLHFKEHAEKIGLKAVFEDIPGYKHEWRFWDLSIEKALDFFGIPKKC